MQSCSYHDNQEFPRADWKNQLKTWIVQVTYTSGCKLHLSDANAMHLSSCLYVLVRSVAWVVLYVPVHENWVHFEKMLNTHQLDYHLPSISNWYLLYTLVCWARDCAALHCLAITVWCWKQPRRSLFKSRSLDWRIARNSGRSDGIRTSRIKLQATSVLTGTSCWKTTWQSLDVKYLLISAVILVCLSFSGLAWVGNEIEKMASLGELALIVQQVWLVPAVQGRMGLGRSLHPHK